MHHFRVNVKSSAGLLSIYSIHLLVKMTNIRKPFYRLRICWIHFFFISQVKTKTFLSESGRITGLKYGKRYKCQVRALYKKSSYNLCSHYSNTVFFMTSKVPKTSIKLNKIRLTILNFGIIGKVMSLSLSPEVTRYVYER